MSGLINSFSILTIILFINSMLLFGTAILPSNPDIHDVIPGNIKPGSLIIKPIAIARGQTLKFEAYSEDSLILTVISGYVLKEYQENPLSELTLYNNDGKSFQLEITASNYTVVYFLWNNSATSTSEMPIYRGHISISGFDFDLILESSMLILACIMIEGIKSSGIINKINKDTLLTERLRSNSFFKKHNPSEKQEKTGRISSLSYYGEILLVLRQEKSLFSKSTMVFLFIFYYLLSNPSTKFLFVRPSEEILGISLIANWLSILNLFIVIWVCLIIFITLGIWKARLESNEFKHFFSLPLHRKSFLAAIILILVINCSLVTIVPFISAILLNYLRFSQVPNFIMILTFFFHILSWQAIFLLITGTICLMFPYQTFYNIFVVILAFISGIFIFKSIFLSNNIFLITPIEFDLLINYFELFPLKNPNLFTLMIGPIILVIITIFLHFIAIRTLEVT